MSELYAVVADVLRCTAHINERNIRAKYIVQDLLLRGYTIVRSPGPEQRLCPTCAGRGIVASIEGGLEAEDGCSTCGGKGTVLAQ